MTKEQRGRIPTMYGPAIYEIHVRGSLNGDWSNQLGGLQITESHGSDGQAQTTLVGRLPDQAALTGVLNTLYELHMPVISVECVDGGSRGDGDE